MFLNQHGALLYRGSFPRIRGDVPEYIMAYVRDLWFSPHTRGCSYFIRDDTIVHGVFPAYAGMFRTSAPVKSKSTSFPRIRGDVPGLVEVAEYHA